MSIVQPSTFRPPFYLRNCHVQTIIPALFRKPKVDFERQRIDTPDGDFLDLDWSCIGSQKLAILSHGLEGDTTAAYIRGMAKALNEAGYDVLAWNYRSCSGEMNRLLRFYHSGETSDLAYLVAYCLGLDKYKSLSLIGFSLGGNVTLKYLGEQGDKLPAGIEAAVVFSVPCDLQGAAIQLEKPKNAIYLGRFLRSLKEKIRSKKARYPDELDTDGLEDMRDFHAFDERYTAPMHGFSSAKEYYRLCSSRPFIPSIRVPVLIVNALNDPFLSPSCFPVEEAGNNPIVFLEMPASGGHVGFFSGQLKSTFWSEKRAVEFLSSYAKE